MNGAVREAEEGAVGEGKPGEQRRQRVLQPCARAQGAAHGGRRTRSPCDGSRRSTMPSSSAGRSCHGERRREEPDAAIKIVSAFFLLFYSKEIEIARAGYVGIGYVHLEINA